jgi:RNA polymerase sigma-70 factor (ECF subfamily)
LVERARSGDAAAFEDIVRRFHGPVRSYAGRILRDPHLGDDATQETFFRMWKGLPGHEPRGKFAAWTFTVARNTCLELLRREARTPRPAEEIDRGFCDPFDYVDLALVLTDAIARLSEPYRSTLRLRASGMKHDEIATVLRCPVGTIRSRIHKARMSVAAELGPESASVR